MNETQSVGALLGLRAAPVAVGFLESAPDGLPAWSEGARPAGCSYWGEAMAGKAFYTVPSDHHNCAVGSYTHNIPLPEERSNELMDTVGFMVQNHYIAMEEVPGIPVLPSTPDVVAYAPADSAPFAPDVVIVAAKPAQMMELYEAAVKAGVTPGTLPAIGRPGCAVLPMVKGTAAAALSFGCKGNRTFTGLPDDELYLAVPGAQWPAVRAALVEAHQANAAMGSYYQDKLAGSAERR